MYHWLVVANDALLIGGRGRLSGGIATFAVNVAAEMAPKSHLVVYAVHQSGQVVVASLTFPVDAISHRNKFRVLLNPLKDLTKKTIEVAVYGEPGALVGLNVVDENLYKTQWGNDLSRAQVLERMNEATSAARNNSDGVRRSDETLTWRWTSRDGSRPDERVYYSAQSLAVDANRTFAYAGLVVFT